MTSGISHILERLETHAHFGKVSKQLNLYSNQERILIKEGFSVTRGDANPKWAGQHSCIIDWSNPQPNTLAYDLLVIASKDRYSSSAQK